MAIVTIRVNYTPGDPSTYRGVEVVEDGADLWHFESDIPTEDLIQACMFARNVIVADGGTVRHDDSLYTYFLEGK